MINIRVPLVEVNNPFYCPKPRKTTMFIAMNGHRQHATTLSETSCATPGNEIDPDWILGEWFGSRNPCTVNPGKNNGCRDPPPYIESIGSSPASSPSPLARPRNLIRKDVQPLRIHKVTSVASHNPEVYQKKPETGRKRKYLEDFSDFHAPPKYARSIQSVHDSSFDLVVRREKLQLDDVPSSSPRGDAYSNTTNGNKSDPPDIGTLIDLLDATLPGVRLSHRLRAIDPRTVDDIAMFLSVNGMLIYGLKILILLVPLRQTTSQEPF